MRDERQFFNSGKPTLAWPCSKDSGNENFLDLSTPGLKDNGAREKVSGNWRFLAT